MNAHQRRVAKRKVKNEYKKQLVAQLEGQGKNPQEIEEALQADAALQASLESVETEKNESNSI